MEIFESESITCGKVKAEVPPQTPEEPVENHSASSSNKQGSTIFSLTLDEFQNKSGKSFGSMNMDEFLTSVWSAEGNQASSNPNLNEPIMSDENVATETTLPRQGSFSIPTPLCDKTVEEVWSEMNKDQTQQHDLNTINNHEIHLRQQTFGEMTLEDFLVKAGVIREPSSFSSQQGMLETLHNHCGDFPVSNNSCLDANVGTGQMMGYEFSNHSNYAGNNLIGNGSSMYQMFSTQSGSFVGEPSQSHDIGNGKCNGKSEVGEPSSRRSKIKSGGSMEVAVERRQRRMIKNRESAARSRARKQAYTAELEIELNQLKEENARLKLVVAEVEMKRKQEVMKEQPPTKAQRIAEKFKTMRRASSLS